MHAWVSMKQTKIKRILASNYHKVLCFNKKPKRSIHVHCHFSSCLYFKNGKRLNLFTKKGRNILIFLIKYWLQNLVKIRTLFMGGRVLIDNIRK